MSTTIGENVRQLRESRGWSQEDLARQSGTSQTTVFNIESGETKQSKLLPRIAVALGVPLVEIDEALGGQSRKLLAIPRAELVVDADLPVFASVEGGKGQIIISNEVVDRVRRPASLLHVRDGYGVLVTGDSMVPTFRPGDIALVHPHLPPRIDDSVILQTASQDKALIKEFRGETDVEWRLRRYRPKEQDFAIPKLEWPIVHTVVGRYMRR